MKLGYYYHTEVAEVDGELHISGYQGVFIDSIAACVDELVLFLHALPVGSEIPDYKLKSDNITWVNLGHKPRALKRFFSPKSILLPFREAFDNLDAMLARSPSLLAPAFRSLVDSKRLFYFMVGDYRHDAQAMRPKTLRDRAVVMFLKRIDRMHDRMVHGRVIFVNSQALKEKYLTRASKVIEVRTTTISALDMRRRQDTCQGEHINLLYAGRFVHSKGLFELMDAFNELVKGYPNIRLNFVGWEGDPLKPTESALMGKARAYGIEDKVLFHGLKKVGQELNDMYHNSDIYIIPSYHEGFPRTIWEALGQSTPVIATRVGGIPHLLKDGVDVLLIEPKNVSAIVQAVELVINNHELRKRMIRNGFETAKLATLEGQSPKLIELIREELCTHN